MIQKPCINLNQSVLIKKYTLGETTGFRSSRSWVFKNFVNSTVKHMCLSPLACNFIKKRLQFRCFSVKFTKFLRALFFIGKLHWLLLRFNSCSQRSPGQKPMRTRYNTLHYIQYLLDLVEKGICCRENPEAATIGVL